MAPYRIWGEEHLESDAVQQLKNACRLPVAVSGALMPDAHVGYGLPIGGVLATKNAVIPYDVMKAQRDLVEPIARFEPRLVKMAPAGEPAED